MALQDDILQGTLSGTTTGINAPATPKALTIPNTTGSNKQDIANLSSAQKTPESLLNLQKAMQLSSQTAYKERQASELTQAGQQFDPTKVSGGTFASILGNLEQNRGGDISKIYQSTMQTYKNVQDTVTQRLQYLKELEEQRRQFEAEMKLRKEELKMQKESAKDAKKQWEKEYNEGIRQWQAQFDLAAYKAQTSSSASSYYSNIETNKAIYQGGYDTGYSSQLYGNSGFSVDNWLTGK